MYVFTNLSPNTLLRQFERLKLMTAVRSSEGEVQLPIRPVFDSGQSIYDALVVSVQPHKNLLAALVRLVGEEIS
jgi:hypothetical protein